MITSPGTLEQLQTVAFNLLAADPMFNGSSSYNQQPVPIITELKGDITQQIELALGSVGIRAMVLTPTFEFFENLLTPAADGSHRGGWALINVSIFEDVPVNLGETGTKIPSIRAIEHVIAILHQHPTGIPTGALDQDIPAFIGIDRPIEMTNIGPPLQYTASFQAHIILM